MRTAFLGSGSSGNATAVESEGQVILVDAGFSAREPLRRLGLAGMRPEDVRAVLVTHEHTDHIGGVQILAKRLGIPVYATAGTGETAGMHEWNVDFRRVDTSESFAVASLTIQAFALSHDAAEPVGYRIESCSGESLGLVTDTGVMPSSAIEVLSGCTILAIECNHDEKMLQTGPYPWFLKRRIASDQGHLSNVAAFQVIERLASDRLEAVVALHLSRQNNHAGIVRDGLETQLRQIGLACQTKIIAQDAGCVVPLGECA